MKKHLITLLMILAPISAFADVTSSGKGLFNTFTVCGNIDSVYSAFQRLALICANPEYQYFCMGAFVISFLATAIATFSKGVSFSIQTGDMMNWGLQALAGLILYFGFIQPTTNINIYDATYSEMKIVNGVPDIVAIIACGMNAVETELINIVDESSTPTMLNPSGLGYNVLMNSFAGVDLANTPNGGTGNAINIGNYVNDCVTTEILRPGTKLTVDAFMSNTDFLPLLQLAASTTAYTTDYQGNNMTCSAAYGNIADYLNFLTDSSPAVTRWISDACAKVGMTDFKVPFGLGPHEKVCADLHANLVNQIINSTVDAPLANSDIFKQVLVTQQLYNFTKSGGNNNAAITAIGDFNQGTAMISAGLMAAEWMPQIKVMMLSAFFGMLPFLMIFMITAKWQKLLLFTLGCSLFFSTWNICDAVLHQFALDRALAVMQEIRSDQLGMRGILMMSGEAMRAYAVFGQYQIWSMGLAVLFAGALTSVGASQLGRLSSQHVGDLNHSAAEAGNQVMNPLSSSRALEGYQGAIPTHGIANSNSLRDLSDSNMLDKKSHLGTNMAYRNHYGGVDNASRIIAGNNLMRTINETSSTNAMEASAAGRGVSADKNSQDMANVDAARKTSDAVSMINLTGGKSNVGDLRSNVTDSVATVKNATDSGKAIGTILGNEAMGTSIVGSEATKANIEAQQNYNHDLGVKSGYEKSGVSIGDGEKFVTETNVAANFGDKTGEVVAADINYNGSVANQAKDTKEKQQIEKDASAKVMTDKQAKNSGIYNAGVKIGNGNFGAHAGGPSAIAKETESNDVAGATPNLVSAMFDSMLTGKQMSSGNRLMMKGIQSNHDDMERFKTEMSKNPMSRVVQTGEGEKVAQMLNMPPGSGKDLEGKAINITAGMDDKGHVTFAYSDAKGGSNISQVDNNTDRSDHGMERKNLFQNPEGNKNRIVGDFWNAKQREQNGEKGAMDKTIKATVDGFMGGIKTFTDASVVESSSTSYRAFAGTTASGGVKFGVPLVGPHGDITTRGGAEGSIGQDSNKKDSISLNATKLSQALHKVADSATPRDMAANYDNYVKPILDEMNNKIDSAKPTDSGATKFIPETWLPKKGDTNALDP
jgi:conjugal transfer mating pair stabilization protein TraG